MKGRPVAKSQLLAAIDAVDKAAGNVTHAAEALRVPRPTLHTWLRIAKLELGKTPKPTKQKIFTVGDAVIARQEKSRLAESQAQLKEALETVAALEARIKELEWSASGSYKAADWTLRQKRATKGEHTPYLLTSDFQVGEVVRASEIDGGSDYDHHVFHARYRRLIETCIYLAQQHSGSSWKFPGIIYGRDGDSISGGIHDELRETDDLTPIQAVEFVYEAEAWGIRQLAEAFGKVDVKSPGSGGNHDRNTLKPRAKGAVAHSYDRLIAFMLRREFAKDSRVTFHVSDSPDILFPIYDKQILLTHGDRIGSRGGHGFIGPAATILRGAQKVITEQGALGRRVDRVDMGHHHYPLILDWCICNGSFTGYTEFGKMNRMRPFKAQQMFMFHHPKHGVVDYKPITLE